MDDEFVDGLEAAEDEAVSLEEIVGGHWTDRWTE